MSVTPPVSHVEMWPYFAAAAVASVNHAATACLIFQLTMTLPVRETSQSTPAMPHDVDAHEEPSNALSEAEKMLTQG